MAAAFDLLQESDAAQQMLVHGIVMVHVELHHRDDLAKGADELTEHPGLVHAPQHDFGVVRSQDFHEQPVGFRVFAQLAVNEPERARHRAHRVGVKRQIVLLRESENPDQIDRVVPEDVRRGQVNAVVVNDEIVAVGHPPPVQARSQARHHAAQDRRRLGLLIFQFGAQDRGEIADVLGDQEIMLHEAFDILHAGM